VTSYNLDGQHMVCLGAFKVKAKPAGWHTVQSLRPYPAAPLLSNTVNVAQAVPLHHWYCTTATVQLHHRSGYCSTAQL
jgi:hypothetical protein